MGSDDLAPLLVPHHSADSGPTPALSSEEPARYGQGTILTWDAETFENTVRFRGTVLQNLPVMAGTDALTFQPGDKVGIMYWAPAGGSGVFWILPRIIVPGSGAAEQAIASMQTDIGRRVAAAVLADRIHTVVAAGQTRISSGTFGDGTAAGPVVPDVEITEAGKALVIISAMVDSNPLNLSRTGGVRMSFEVSGATNLPPSVLRGLGLMQGVEVVGSTGSHSFGGTLAAVEVVNLNPGTHTFTAKYASAVDGHEVSFSGRSLTVIAF